MNNTTLDKSFLTACEQGNLREIQRILPQISNINVKTAQGWTGLVMAVYAENIDLAKLLLENGADINATNTKGTTVFMYAKTPVFESQDYSLLEYLLSQGADINAKDQFGLTVLDYVVKKGDPVMEKWMREQGAY